MMSYLPNSRNSSAMTRSLSTPNLNDNNKENSNKNKKNKSSFTNDKKKIIKEAKVAPVVEKKAKDSSSPFKYSNQNKSKFFIR